MEPLENNQIWGEEHGSVKRSKGSLLPMQVCPTSVVEGKIVIATAGGKNIAPPGFGDGCLRS